MSMNNYDMTWEVASEAFEASGPKVNFMKLQAGDNRIRIGSGPSRVYQHWETTASGKPLKVTCIGDNCPLCQLGHQPVIRYQIKVLDKQVQDDPQPKVLEVGASIMRQISNCAKDPEYGDPTKYDIKIRKDGVGRDTKYIVMASPRRSDFTEREEKMIASLPSMSEINKELSADEIRKMPLQCFNNFDSSHTEDDEFSSASNITGRNVDAAKTDWDALG